MSINCVWCGKEIEEIKGQATMDTCEECEDFFEDNILNISKTLNELLKENESSKDKKDAEKKSMDKLLSYNCNSYVKLKTLFRV